MSKYLTLLRYWWQRQQHRRTCVHCQEGTSHQQDPLDDAYPAPASVKVYQHGAVAATWYYDVPIPAGLTADQARAHAEQVVRDGLAAPYDMSTSDPLDSRYDDIEVEIG